MHWNVLRRFGRTLSLATSATLLTILLLFVTPQQTRAQDEVLFVVASTTLSEADLGLYSIIDGMGLLPVPIAAGSVSSADAEGKVLVFVSETVSSANVTAKFIETPVPFVTFEGFVQDDMNMTGPAENTDYGFVGDAGTTINIVGDHPLLGGLPPGPVQIYAQDASFQWGIPPASAQVLATLADDPSRAVLYIVEEGVELNQGTVTPSRWAFFTPHSTGTAFMSEAGTLLIANLLFWAMGREDEYESISAEITALFTATPSSGFVPLTVEFDASASASPGTITSYQWDFGDGSSGEGVTVSNEYTESGQYLVTLTIEDDLGASTSVSRTIAVGDPVSFEPHFTIPFTAAAPAIDGEVEATWEEAVSLSLDNTVNGAAPLDADDLSATVRVLYDDEHLYVLYEVSDADLFNDSDASWEDDAVDLYIDGGLEKCFNCYDDNDAQFEFSWDSDMITGGAGGGPLAERVVYAWAGTDVGYNIEASVPWANFGVDPVPGRVIGIEFMVNDDDDGATRETKIAWFAEGDDTYQYAHLMGNAALGERSVAREGADELPMRMHVESVYPNPFRATATALLQVPQAGTYEIEVFNVIGLRVERLKARATSPGALAVPIDLNGHPSGVYLLRVRPEGAGASATMPVMLVR